MRTLPFVLVIGLAACGGKSTPPAGGGDTGSGSAAPSDPAGPAQLACIKTGCSSTVCTEAGNEVMTTCEFKAEYACYQQATCERQPDGACGWTQTEALTACLASPPPM